ncbi:conserved hypothetical protein [Dehalogenimonas lykanthroporepellens BL-DC-9]|jgi:hypothetical protein|nr:conserved hypothetical protein [Dehalogenimonas lykanthroporepellens BL-DC-9]
MLKKGDRVSISFRTGKDTSGNYIIDTLPDAEVEEYTGSILRVRTFEQVPGPKGDEVEIKHFTFDVNSPEFVGAIHE